MQEIIILLPTTSVSCIMADASWALLHSSSIVRTDQVHIL